MTSYETLLVEREGAIATVTFNRPDQLNAANPTVMTELKALAEELDNETELDAVIFTGAGRAFIAGADIKAMVDFDRDAALQFSQLGHAAVDAVASLPMVTIAAINGFALGGGLEIALACDLLYGSEKARLGLPEVSLGVIPGWGGTQRLGRRIGWQRAQELVFTGRHVKADEAKEIGLLLDVFPLDGFLDSVKGVAQSIGKNGPLAVRTAKAAMRKGAASGLEEGLEFEKARFGQLFHTNDRREGMVAFVEGRPPNFSRS